MQFQWEKKESDLQNYKQWKSQGWKRYMFDNATSIVYSKIRNAVFYLAEKTAWSSSLTFLPASPL